MVRVWMGPWAQFCDITVLQWFGWSCMFVYFTVQIQSATDLSWWGIKRYMYFKFPLFFLSFYSKCRNKDVLANLCCFALYHLIRWCGLNLHYEMLGGHYPEVRVLCFMLLILKEGVILKASKESLLSGIAIFDTWKNKIRYQNQTQRLKYYKVVWLG